MVVTTINKKLSILNCWTGGNSKKYIVLHDVGVKGQTALNNINYFSKAFRGASAHYFVDRTSIWQLADDNNRCWHVGDDKDDSDDGINNHNSIGIEMIVEKDGTIHPETKANTRWLVNHLQEKYKISDSKIVRHFDASGKNCPQFLNKDKRWSEWQEFYKYITQNENATAPIYNSSSLKKTKVIVKKGDSLWGISQQYNVTVDQLKEWNKLKSDTISIGQELYLTKDSKPSAVTNSKSSSKANLVVDGYWGTATTIALQKALGTTVDGIISGQYQNSITKAIFSVDYGTGGSLMVKALQKKIGAKIDGYIGVETIKRLQKYLGTTQDGIISKPSNMVKELQRRLNAGTF